MNNDEESYIDLGYLTLGEKYLHTAGRILEQMIMTGNPHMLSYNHGDFEKITEEYNEQTKWSDFNVLIPTLFLFYHGLELILKGLVLLNEQQDNNNLTNHNIEKLLEKVKAKYSDKNCLINILQRYIIDENYPEVLKQYIKDNKLKSAKELYFSLRYPTNKQLQISYSYFSMKYREGKIISFAQELKNDINTLCQESVKIYR